MQAGRGGVEAEGKGQRAEGRGSTWQLILHHGPSKQNRGVGIQPHALIHTPHDILELGVVLHGGLLSVSHHCVNLLLSLHRTAVTAISK